jgi:hypothetical protein
MLAAHVIVAIAALREAADCGLWTSTNRHGANPCTRQDPQNIGLRSRAWTGRRPAGTAPRPGITCPVRWHYPRFPRAGPRFMVSGCDPSPVRFLPSMVRVTAPGLPSFRVTACRSVHVFEVPVPTMPSKIVAPPGVVRSAQQGSLTAVTAITTARAWAAAGGAGVVFAAGCLRAALCAVAAVASGPSV